MPLLPFIVCISKLHKEKDHPAETPSPGFHSCQDFATLLLHVCAPPHTQIVPVLPGTALSRGLGPVGKWESRFAGQALGLTGAGRMGNYYKKLSLLKYLF